MLTVKVPATSANLGPGFDSLGLALNMYNVFKFKKQKRSFNVKVKDMLNNRLMDIKPEDNYITIAMRKVFAACKLPFKGVTVIEESYLPLARGLGSSATAIIGGLLGANYLLENPLTKKELIKIALTIEEHPDNLVPALIGGFTVSVITENDLIYKKIELPLSLKTVIVIPDFELKTLDLRKVLPENITYDNAIFNLSRTALLTAIFKDEDWGKLATAMQDCLHQDYRARLIPGFENVIKAGYKAGAYGVALSGAGPSFIAFCTKKAENIGEAMVKAFSQSNISSRYVVSEPSNSGAKIEML